MIIETFKNEADGLESRIAARADGRFAVSLFDTDAQEQVMILRLFDALEPARVYACRLAMAN